MVSFVVFASDLFQELFLGQFLFLEFSVRWEEGVKPLSDEYSLVTLAVGVSGIEMMPA